MSNELSPSPQVLICYFWIKPTSLQQAHKNLVGFSPSTFLHCPTAQFSCFCIKNCEILICAVYADNNNKKKQPTGHLATRFHWWLFHRNMLASPSASCGSIQGCWDLQSQFWNFSAHTQPCLNVSSLQLHPLWCWSPHHSSYTSQGLGQAEQIHSHLPSTLFLLALWWELRRWRERWASQWRWLITTQVRGLFVLLSFLNVISTGGNWERTERQNVIWANNKWLIYKKLTNNNNNKQTKKISWSCQNGTVKKNCKLNICGLFLSVVTVEGNKHSLVNTKNKFTKFSCHVFNIV